MTTPRLTRSVRQRLDEGETLLELLITIMIVSTALVALIAALMATVRGSSQIAGASTLQATLRSYGDALTNVVDENPTGTQYQYRSCASTTHFPVPTSLGVSPQPGSTISVATVRFEATATVGVFRQAADGGTPCTTAGSGVDSGVQQLVLVGQQTVAGAPSVSETLTVMVRRPCAATAVAAPANTPATGPC